MMSLDHAPIPIGPVDPLPGTQPSQTPETRQHDTLPAATTTQEQAPPLLIEAPAWPRIFPSL